MSKALKITNDQRITFFSYYNKACKIRGWDPKDDAFRYRWISEQIGRDVDSLSQVGRVGEFTKVLAGLKGIVHDTDVEGQVKMANMELTNLLVKIGFVPAENGFVSQAMELEELLGGQSVAESYILGIVKDKFHTHWGNLTVPQLEQMRSTLAARIVEKRREVRAALANRETNHLPDAGKMVEALTTGADDSEGDPQW